MYRLSAARALEDDHHCGCSAPSATMGTVAGFIMARLTGFGTSPNAIAISPRLHLIRTGAVVAALITMMVMGLIVALDSRLQVQELKEKLEAIQEDM